MLKLLLVCLISLTAISQTKSERNKIIDLSDRNKSIELTDYLLELQSKNELEVAQYLIKNPNTLNPKNIQFILNDTPYYYGVDFNANSSATLRANSMYPGGSLGLSVTGNGVTVGVWDGDKVRNTHVEFGSRVVPSDGASTLSSHSTHVTGTILASGISSLRKGIAFEANALTYDFGSDAVEMNQFAGQGYLVSNHSYGIIAANVSDYFFGQYSTQSNSIDQILFNYPYYQVVKSAGNDRSTTTIPQVVNKQGYDLLTGMSCSKNVLTVAAVNEVTNYVGSESVTISSFSNYGPTDDGRIKPDISAMGVSVSSCNSPTDTSYTVMSGTSMSAPAISGLILLLQKHYNNLNAGNYMRSASVRTLICQSAREAGSNNGPDYEFGWGLADGYAAAQIISGNNSTALLSELTLNNGQTYTRTFTVNSTQDLNVAIGWTDPAGAINTGTTADIRTPRLVNNLDLKVLKDGTTYYPWKMNPDDVVSGATNDSDNDVDNIERINIYGATPGVYTIQVTHKGNLTGGLQDFSLVASGSAGLNLATQNFESDNTFFIYPNPASTEIHFNNPKDFALNQVSVFDVTGKLVLQSSSVVNNTIDVASLNSGIYMVKITSDNGVYYRKFSKK
ncbi:MAG: hypothetical protein RLZZ500_1988 [Bacteroidota bacterium]